LALFRKQTGNGDGYSNIILKL